VAIAEELGSLIAIVNAYWSHGLALMLEGEWEASQERIEAALEIARANRVWLTVEGDALASLAEAKLGLGEVDEALRTSDLAVSTTLRSETPTFELHARLVRARVLVALEGGGAEAEAERELNRAEELLQSTGARSYAPAILEERAGLVDTLGFPAKATQLRRDRARPLPRDGRDGPRGAPHEGAGEPLIRRIPSAPSRALGETIAVSRRRSVREVDSGWRMPARSLNFPCSST
jgi:tetratricopeptide (TPR) repeat protein